MVAIHLQHRVGIRVHPSRLIPLTECSQIFVTERFNREGDLRIPYMSARTALQLDAYRHPDYVTLTREVAMISAAPIEDANEMFSRAALGAMVNNIDDHMRNHGLLRLKDGWRVSPSFDVNPAPTGSSETPLVPDGDAYDRNVLELLDHLDSFRLTRAAAIERLRRVKECFICLRRRPLGETAVPSRPPRSWPPSDQANAPLASAEVNKSPPSDARSTRRVVPTGPASCWALR